MVGNSITVKDITPEREEEGARAYELQELAKRTFSGHGVSSASLRGNDFYIGPPGNDQAVAYVDPSRNVVEVFIGRLEETAKGFVAMAARNTGKSWELHTDYSRERNPNDGPH